MARPNSNGIVALHDDKEDNRGFFCMKLAEYISNEIPIGDNLYSSLWRIRFAQAKSGKCAYRDKCPIYAKSKGSSVAVIYDRGGVFHREDIRAGIKKYENFKNNAHRFKAILVIDKNRNVYEWNHTKK